MEVHDHEVCTEDHSGTSTHGLPDPAWLGKTHCMYCGEVAPEGLTEIVELIEKAVAQAEAEAMILEAEQAIATLPVARRIIAALDGMPFAEIEEIYGHDLAELYLELWQAVEMPGRAK